MPVLLAARTIGDAQHGTENVHVLRIIVLSDEEPFQNRRIALEAMMRQNDDPGGCAFLDALGVLRSRLKNTQSTSKEYSDAVT
jgi:hypothetical protein